MKALVTGHLGFVGSHLTHVLRINGYDVIGVDLKDGSAIGDCTLPDVERVFHLAAQTDAQSDLVAADALTNIMGSIRIFSHYRDKVVFASSSMVNYPASAYAISKRAGEDYARYFGCAIVRFCNLYGEGGHSVIDKFRSAERLTIYGSGEQLRSYAPVSAAVEALLDAKPGQTSILRGVDLSVNDVAAKFAPKPIDRLNAKALDIIDGRQI